MTYTCIADDSTLTTTCGSDGTWSDPGGVCPPTSCGMPDLAVPFTTGHNYDEGTTYENEMTIMFTCTNGESVDMTCSNGEWSEPGVCPSGCAQETIPDPALYTEIAFSLNDHDYVAQFYEAGTGISVTCEDTSTVTLLCGVTGLWATDALECPPGCKDAPVTLEFSTNNFLGPFTYRYQYVNKKIIMCLYASCSETDVTYTCTDGSSLISTCDVNGEWSDPGLCPPGCSDAPFMDYPRVIDNNHNEGFTPSGNDVTLSCSDGVTTLTITCKPDGTWGDVSDECPVGCGGPAPVIEYATNDYVAGFHPEGFEVTYTCDVLGATDASVCLADGTWSPVASCPILLASGKTFWPSAEKTSAIIMSHPGYETGKPYWKNMNVNWYFQTDGKCKPKVTFIGDTYQVKGGKKCKEDTVTIQQWRNGQTWKTPLKDFCGGWNPKNLPVTEAKWNDVRLRIIFKTNASNHGLGFMAKISYEHCY